MLEKFLDQANSAKKFLNTQNNSWQNPRLKNYSETLLSSKKILGKFLNSNSEKLTEKFLDM